MNKAFKKDWVGYCSEFDDGKTQIKGEIHWGDHCLRCNHCPPDTKPPGQKEITEFEKSQEAVAKEGYKKVPMCFRPGCMAHKLDKHSKKPIKEPVLLYLTEVFVGASQIPANGEKKLRYFCPSCFTELSPNIFRDKGRRVSDEAFCHECGNVFHDAVIYKGWGLWHFLKALVGFGKLPKKK